MPDSNDWDRYVDPDLIDLGPDAREFMRDDREEAVFSEAMNVFDFDAVPELPLVSGDQTDFGDVSKLSEPEIPKLLPVPDHGDIGGVSKPSEGTVGPVESLVSQLMMITPQNYSKVLLRRKF